MSASIAALADRYGCELRGDGAHEVTHVAPLGEASSSAISFLANSKFRAQLEDTAAGAVILRSADVSACPVACLIHENPYAIYARIAAVLHPAAVALPGIHADASIADDAHIAASAEIGPQVVIGSGAVIGDSVRVLAGAVIASEVTIGADSCIGANVTIGERVQIGERCIIHPGAVIGGDGFGFALDAGSWVKVPQLGSVRIGNDVEIGANTTIDRGTINDTIIDNGVKLDNLVQIAHNVRVGEHSVMAAMSGAAGSTVIGKRCMIGGGTVMINHISLCDDVLVLFRSVVTKSITKPGTYSGSLPADEASSWRRNAARFKQLDRLADRVFELEKRKKSKPD